MSPAIVTSGLTKRYRRVQALRGLDLTVPAGSVCGFLGPNGAGKTTTMRILMGLSKPTSGTAQVLGTDVAGNGLAVRSRVGYLSQDPSFLPRFRVRDVLRFVARRYPRVSRGSIEERVEETLDLVGLTERADRRVRALSGGERQRLGIGQAVLGKPQLLILDEPSVGLDPEGRAEVLNLIDALREHMTIFYSSHILDDVQRIADHLVILDHGEIIEQGPMEDYLGAGAIYRVVVAGDGESPRALRDHPWVTEVSSLGDGAWEVAVADQATAEKELLRALAGAHLTELRPLARNLEEIYLDLVDVEDGD